MKRVERDTRVRRAAYVRDIILDELKAGPLPVADIDHRVQRAVIFPVTVRQVDAALQVLRRLGAVRYRRPCWERVDG